MNINLQNGDCLELMKGLGDGSVDAVITDPPFNLLKGHKIETGVDMEAFFDECFRVLKKGGFLVYFGMQPSIADWNYFCLKRFLYKSEIIWYKRANSSMMGDISRVYENIMVFNKTEKTRFNDVFRPYTDVKESIGEFYDFKSLEKFVNLCKNLITQEWQFKKAKEFYKSNYNPKLRVAISKNNLKKGNDNYHNVGDDNVRQIHTVSTITRGIKQSNLVSFLPENKATKATNIKQGVKHPTVKPIKLMEYLLELTTNKNDLILDPFMGSGTTGIACANLNRNFIGYELDKDYFEIAKKRINEAEKKHYEKLF